MVPPIRLWDQGVPNQAALTIMTRNSRMPDSLAADLDAECSACLMGARRLTELFERYGRATVEACFDAILDATTETFRREVLAKIPEGQWVWEDYAEHDGVDEPQLHTQRITLTKTPDRLVVDFTGTSKQARGPINHCGDYADGNFLKKWLAPILRNLADTPERMAAARRRRGRRPADRDAVPGEGHAAHAGVPRAGERPHVRHPAAARRARGGAGQGRRRPHAGRPGDDPLHRRLRHRRRRRAVPHARGARRRQRRPVVRRRRGHDPRGARLAEPADRVHRVALPVPRRAARPGRRLRRRGAVPRRPRLRQARPDAARRVVHVDRRPLDPGLLGREGRSRRTLVLGRRRPRRPARARARGARRRRARARRRGDPHPHHRRWRLGRPARPRRRRRRARRPVGQGVGGRCPRRLRRGRDRTARRPGRRPRCDDGPARRAPRRPRSRAVLRPRPRLRPPVGRRRALAVRLAGRHRPRL